jgi:putative membrane-bound dehydrogenase-like protein
MKKLIFSVSILVAVVFGLGIKTGIRAQDNKIKLLFLGDNGHHKPNDRFRQIQPVLAAKGIDLVYTDKVESLTPKILNSYQGLVIFANLTTLSPEQEKAMLDYVEQGNALIPLHCASYCFLNSPKYIDLVGAQFSKHGTGTFRVDNILPTHPIMKGYKSFESWDETYVHTKHNPKDRIVLEERKDASGSEPWTWVRTQGKGKVFYTAWGHDARTWSNPGFQNLLERGIRWATNGDLSKVPAFSDQTLMTELPKNLKPFEYVEADVPFYPANKQWGKMGENIRKMQKPLDPKESQKHYIMPEGFELKLFASEPDLEGKPIAMNWDERGRLWVALTIDYPNELQPQGLGRDKIVICEDTNGDNVADKFTTFADKLSIPTSLIFANGGVIVHQAPDTLFLKDTNGDDKADERKVLFTGWSTGDTHAGPSNLNYGLDNWIYGMVGYSGFVGTVGDEKQSFRTGFYRMKSDGSKIEFLRNTNNNSWGVGLSEEGILFGSTANGNPSVHLPIPNRYYEKVRGWSSSVLEGIAGSAPIHPITKQIRQVDHHDKFTAAAGHALYTARNYPSDYWNKTAFVTEPTGHIVATFPITPEGASFTSRNAFNLVASDDEWSSPIVAEVGPDGNVWVIDWYNYIVQHNPTPAGFKTGKGNAYETNLRDKKHGRIYRLVHKEGKNSPNVNLTTADSSKLVETLRNDNFFWRRHAQRLLVEKQSKDAIPALIELAKETKIDGAGLTPCVIHALWTLKGLGALEEENSPATKVALNTLTHASAGVRLNALKVLPLKLSSTDAILKANLLDDANAQVQLATLLALSDLPPSEQSSKAISKLLKSPKRPLDKWLLDGVTTAAANNDALFLNSVTEKSTPPSIELLTIIERVAEHHARGKPDESIANLLEKLLQSEPLIQTATLKGLARGWPANQPPKLDDRTEKALKDLFVVLPIAARGQLAQLGKKWGSKSLAEQSKVIVQGFLKTASDTKQTDTERISSAKQACEFGASDPEVAKAVLELITAQLSPEVGLGMLEAVSLSDQSETGNAMVERFPDWTPNLRQTAIRILLSRTIWTEALIASLEVNKLRISELSLDQKQALLQTGNKKITDKAKVILARGGGLPNADRQKVIDDSMFATTQSGDANLGKIVYKNQCSKCHQHQGEGVKIGPDMTGMAAHPKKELLIHIMDPNRDVEGNFRQYVVSTKGGKILTGMLASETKSSIELIDTEAKKQTVLRDDIDEIKASDRSLMPEGFEKQLSKPDLVNLLEFLTQRGKFLPLPLDKIATIVSTKGMFHSEEATVERLIFPDWKPKVFQGIPFNLVDPQGDKYPNVIMLHGTNGTIPPKMPKQVKLACNGPANAIHLLSGISGWGFPATPKGSVSMIVRLHYDDGKTEDHLLKNGEVFADYIRKIDVPDSTFAFLLRGQQIRYLAVRPKRPTEIIKDIEFVKGSDGTSPIVMAVTVEGPESKDKPQ